MMRRVLATALGLVMILAMALMYHKGLNAQRMSGKPSLEARLQYLYAQLETLDEHHPDRDRIHAAIQRIKQKLTNKLHGANPGDWLKILQQLQTAPDGSTYAPGHRVKEWRKASVARKKAGEPLDWQRRGPGNVSGRVRALIVDKADPDGDTWFAGSVGGGIWKTADAGENWDLVSPELLSMSTCALAQSASNPEILYAGTGLGFYWQMGAYGGSGIWKSTDGGDSWFQLASTANGELMRAITRIIVDPNDPNLIIAAAVKDTFNNAPGPDSGIFRSTDGGATWTMVLSSSDLRGTAAFIQQLVHPEGEFGQLYATVRGYGILKSTDAGLTWQRIYVASSEDSRIEMAIAPSDTDRLYASVATSSGKLLVSRDQGDTWVPTQEVGGGSVNYFAYFGTGASAQADFDNTLTVHPFDEDVLYVGGIDVYRVEMVSVNHRDSDRLSNWFPDGVRQYVHADQHAMMTIPGENGAYRLVVGNDGGVAVTADEGQTFITTTGMLTTQFYGVAKKPRSNAYVGGMQDNGSWMSSADPNHTSDWVNVGGGDGNETAWHRDNPNRMIVSSQFSNFYASSDGGASWQSVTEASTGTGPFISKLATTASDPDLLFTMDGEGLKRSDNFGKNWLTIPVDGWTSPVHYDTFSISDVDLQVVWVSVVAQGGQDGVRVSTDGGYNFSRVQGNLAPDFFLPLGINSHPTDRGTAWLLFGRPGLAKIMQTTDLGETWTDITGFQDGASTNGFPDVSVWCMLAMPDNPQVLWAGTEIGLVISEDGGATWELADNGMPNVPVYRMFIADNQLVVATHGMGVWTLDMPHLADVPKPQPPLAPRFNHLGQTPEGDVVLGLKLPGTFDETTVRVNGAVVSQLGANDQEGLVTLRVPVERDTTWNIEATSVKEGSTYTAQPRVLSVFDVPDAEETYVDNFDDTDAAERILLSGMTLETISGFSTNAIHTPHPYPNNSEFIAQLKTPITLGEGAVLSYDDVALIEPGTPGTQFGDSGFWDYIVVEGSKSGYQWVPLSDGYDAGFDPSWQSAYNRNTAGSPSLFVHHEIDLLKHFSPGDTIFIRFRLFTDPNTVGWGWAADNVQVTHTAPASNTYQMLYPWISYNENFQSDLVVDNLSDRPLEITLTARRESGASQTVGPLTIEPRAFLREQAGNLFSDLGPGPGFTVMVEASHGDIDGRWVTNSLTTDGEKSPSQGTAVHLSSADGDARKGNRIMLGYLPVASGLVAGPVLVNLDAAPADITLYYYKSDGTLLNPGGTVLTDQQPLQPYARVISDLLPDIDEDVALIAEASVPLTGAVFVFNTLGETAIGNVSALEESDVNSSTLLLPWVSGNEQYESQVVVNNPTDQPVTVTLNATRGDGATDRAEKTIQPHGFLVEPATALFDDLTGGSGYSVRITAPVGGLRARWVTANLHAPSGASPAQGVGISLEGTGTSRRLGKVLSYGFLPKAEGEVAAPVIVNAGDAPTDVALYFYNAQGTLLGTDYFLGDDLPPNQPLAAVVGTLFPGASEDVYMVAVSQGQPLAGVGFIFNERGEPAIGNATAISWERPE